MATEEKLDYEEIEQAFKTTFDFLNQITGEDTFKRYKTEHWKIDP